MFDALVRFDPTLHGSPNQEDLDRGFESYCKQNIEGKNISDYSENTLRMYSKKELFIDVLVELHGILSRIDDGVTLSAMWDDGDEFGATVLVKGFIAEATAKLEDVAVDFCRQHEIPVDEGESAFDKSSGEGLWDFIGDIRDNWEVELERKIYVEELGEEPPKDLHSTTKIEHPDNADNEDDTIDPYDPQSLGMYVCGQLSEEGKIPDGIFDAIAPGGVGKIAKIDLSCTSVVNVDGLKPLANLEELDLNYSHSLMSVSGLSALSKLKYLNLAGCESLTNLHGLESLENLEELNISDCVSLEDVQALSGCTNLKKLDVSGKHRIEDLSCLAALQKLESVDLPFDNSLAVPETVQLLLDKNERVTILGLHLGKGNQWVLAGFYCDDGGWLDEIEISTIQSIPDELQSSSFAYSEVIAVNLPFREVGDTSEDDDSIALATSAVEGASKWAARYIYPYPQAQLLQQYSSGEELSDLSLDSSEKKVTGVLREIVELRKALDSVMFDYDRAIYSSGEMALLALGEKRRKFSNPRSSTEGSKERVNALVKAMENEVEYDTFESIWELIQNVKSEKGLPLADSIDAIALGLVAKHWHFFDDRFCILDKTAKVKPWNEGCEIFLAMPSTAKKQPPK